MRRMTVLFALDHQDWSEETFNIVRRWFIELNETLLTIFYDNNILTACLGFPLAPVADLSYFTRPLNFQFTVDHFHDEVNFGTMHDDVDGCILKILQQIYAPLFRNYDLNENIKSRFCTAMDKFLAYLTSLNSKMAGMTVLYVPYVVKQLAKPDAFQDRELVKNMESVVVFWTTQIRTLLADKTLTPKHDLIVPEDEYEFWLYRCKSLFPLPSFDISIHLIKSIFD